MKFASMVEAFEALSQLRERDPEALSDSQRHTWTQLRNGIESHLFGRPNPPEADRRQYLRVPVKMVVGYWTGDELRDRFVPILGEGGLFIPTDVPLPEKTPVHLRIEVPTRDVSLLVAGRVAWVQRGGRADYRGMGIQFVDLDTHQRQVLHTLISDTLHEYAYYRTVGQA